MSTTIFEVHNVVTGKNEKVPHLLLWNKTYHQPRMEALKNPYAIEKLLREAINEHQQIT